MPIIDEIQDKRLRQLISVSGIFAGLDADTQKQLIIVINGANDKDKKNIVSLFENEAKEKTMSDEDLIKSIDESKKILIQLEKGFTKSKNQIIEGDERKVEEKAAEDLLKQI